MNRIGPKKPRAVKEPMREMGQIKTNNQPTKSKITDQEHTTDINEWDQSKENERGMRLEREDHALSNRMIRAWHA